MSYLAGEKLTAALLNALLTRCGSYNAVATTEATTSGTFTDLATVGPTVTLSSQGTLAVVLFSATQFSNAVVPPGAIMGVAVSGATTIAATSNEALVNESNNTGNATQQCQFLVLTITPGSNTYTCKYASESGGTSVSHGNRRMWVFAP